MLVVNPGFVRMGFDRGCLKTDAQVGQNQGLSSQRVFLPDSCPQSAFVWGYKVDTVVSMVIMGGALGIVEQGPFAVSSRDELIRRNGIRTLYRCWI